MRNFDILKNLLNYGRLSNLSRAQQYLNEVSFFPQTTAEEIVFLSFDHRFLIVYSFH